MALFKISNTRIAGIAACVPKTEVSNMDYNWISLKERSTLIKTTGVEKRRVIQKKGSTTTSDLAYVASERLIEDLKWDKKDIDLLVFISQSRDYNLPHTSAIIQDRLGLGHNCMAFDVSLGCTAYVYGLSIIQGMISAGQIKKGLVLVGDISSIGSYRDKSSYPLFGDAATVTAVEYTENENPAYFNLQTDGSGFDAIIMPDGGMRNKYDNDSLTLKKYGDGIYRTNCNVVLNGVEVFNFSLREVAPNIRTLMEWVGKPLDDIDYLVLHQANKLMNNSIRMKLKVSKDKTPETLSKYGNTSAATIPLTIVSELREQILNGKQNLLLSGFGVGLSWGSTLIDLENVVCPEVLIYEDELPKYNQNQYHFRNKVYREKKK